MTPKQTMAFKASQSDDFNLFYTLERILEKDNDPFKALAVYERYERQVILKNQLR